MTYVLFGFPIVFWLGLLTLASFIYQLYLGYRLTHGRSDYFVKHRINAGILSLLVFVHIIFGLALYF